MKLLCKNWIIIAAVCGANLAHAQLPYFENFDAMRADSFDWASQERLISSEFEYGLDESPSRVRGPRDGVTPFSGNRMFEMRSSVYKGRTRTMRPHIDTVQSSIGAAIELSLKFCVPFAYGNGNKITFEIRGQDFSSGRFEFNVQTNEFHYEDYTVYKAHQTFGFTVARNE